MITNTYKEEIKKRTPDILMITDTYKTAIKFLSGFVRGLSGFVRPNVPTDNRTYILRYVRVVRHVRSQNMAGNVGPLETSIEPLTVLNFLNFQWEE